MPRFKLDKLVRDGLKDEYERSGQKTEYKELTVEGHKAALIRKIIEEALEIKVTDSNDDLIKEIADIEQALDDFKKINEITDEQVQVVKQKKFDKIGGFIGATYVNTLELADDDEWVKYYRSRPDIFPEV
jgi:predicted house-cleaning noncanonical NTP pyrophosphatase (MazG superfamily)